MRLPAKSNAIKAAPMNSGWNGSKTVNLPIHAPETPKVINTNGPRQHADANRVASPPVSRLGRPILPLFFCVCVVLMHSAYCRTSVRSQDK